MDGVNLPYLPSTFWLMAAALTIAVLLVSFGYQLYFRKRITALLGDERRVAALAARIATLEADEKEIRDSIQIQMAELNRLVSERETQEKLRAELAELEHQRAAKESENQDLRKEAGQLENQLHTTSERIAKLDKEASILEEKRKEADLIEKRLSDNALKLDEMMGVLREGAAAKIGFDEMLRKRASVEVQIDELKRQKESAQIETAEQIEITRQAQSDAAEAKEKVNLERKKNEELEFENTKLSAAANELKASVGKLQGNKEEAEKLKKFLSELQEKVDHAKKELQLFAHEQIIYQNLVAEKNTLESRIQESKEEELKAKKLKEIQVEIARQAQEHAAEKKMLFVDLEKRADELEGQNEELTKKNKAVAAETEALKDKKTVLENQLLYSQRKSEELKSEIAKLETDLRNFSQKLDVLMQDVKETKDELAIQERFEREEAEKVRQAKLEVNQLRNEENALRTSIKILEKKMAESKGAGADIKEKYSDLWHPISFSALVPIAENLREKEALEKTAKYISGQKLRFHQRTLLAFHTALKVSDISPIVVLAGISGTGKSELPRRYAEGMGLHFVILPVQPRWDSPQDLFGFYNYLEGRYKATELARAMVQFELYSRSSWPLPNGWNHGRSDRMLLVLLDEMNLARVEFYFSEFLSRLETRRGIDQKDEKQRAKAEIALEMGSLGEGETAIKLFPGHNILFAGTMNEDETTQALSDKVLDRACVLRFGRPKKFSKQDFPVPTRPCEQGVTFEQWNSWVKKESLPDDREKVDEWINQLNEAMEQLDRPFGHRVAQAIQSYVANYPDWVTNRLRNAMADQIEQRILPKLRGIEISEAMDAIKKIERVIEACEDQKLLNAFKQGHSNEQMFIWRGIDRLED